MTHDIKVRNGVWLLNEPFEDSLEKEAIEEHIKRTLLMTDQCCDLNQDVFAGFNFEYIAVLMGACSDILINGTTQDDKSKRAYLELYNIYKSAIESVKGVIAIKTLNISKGDNNRIKVQAEVLIENGETISI